MTPVRLLDRTARRALTCSVVLTGIAAIAAAHGRAQLALAAATIAAAAALSVLRHLLNRTSRGER